MNKGKLQLSDGIHLDARRAVWLEHARTLVIADVHLGCAWAERRRGQLLPVSRPEDTVARLIELKSEYQPQRVVFLGDLVHAATPIKSLENELRETVQVFYGTSELTLVAGNHDRNLSRLLPRWGINLEIVTSTLIGPHLLIHGDGETESDTVKQWLSGRMGRGRLLLGHEHPSIRLEDGQVASMRCPCFVVAEDRLMLPAFSKWAAGSPMRLFLSNSAYARGVQWEKVVAIVGNRLLSLPWTMIAGWQ